MIGEVEDIIFRNEENGYTVAVVSRGKEKTVVVGKFLSVKAGQSVRLEGNFVMNKKYGEQFSVESAEIVEPTTAEGIEKYLSSGLIPGVGPVTAKSMVEKFGDQTLDVIEFSPEKLSKVRGISNHKAEVIAEKLKLERSAVYNKSSFFNDYVDLCGYTLKGTAIPANSRIITSDDVFDFMLNLRMLN